MCNAFGPYGISFDVFERVFANQSFLLETPQALGLQFEALCIIFIVFLFVFPNRTLHFWGVKPFDSPVHVGQQKRLYVQRFRPLRN